MFLLFMPLYLLSEHSCLFRISCLEFRILLILSFLAEKSFQYFCAFCFKNPGNNLNLMVESLV